MSGTIFQFHIGAIISNAQVIILKALDAKFQFHIGAIISIVVTK